MKAIGKVIETSGKFARVRSERRSACSSCHECASKGACHAELVFGNQTEEISVLAENKVGANKGDVVELESSTSGTLLLCFLAFVLPIATSGAVYLILNTLFSHSNVLPLLMIAVFVICFMISVTVLNRFVRKKASAVIVRIIEESIEEIEGK